MDKSIATSTTPPQRDSRLDLIKAICIVLVLFWHLQPIDIAAPKLTQYHFDLLLKEGIKTFYLQVTLLAVPTFLLVALYLYFGKLAKHGYKYLWIRLPRLIQIFLFWVACQLLMFYLLSIPKSLPLAEQWNLLKVELQPYAIFIAGGPQLPEVGGSVFYYLSMLVILTVLATLFFHLAQNRAVGIGIGAIIIAGSLLYFEYCSLHGIIVLFFDVSTFVIYIPIAYFLQFNKFDFSKSLFIFIVAGYIFFTIQDYELRKLALHINVYLRASIVFGAIALFYGINNLKIETDFKVTNFLSTYSLGIFAIHKYFQYFVITLLTPYFIAEGITKKVSYGNFRVNIQTLMIAALATVTTLLCVFLLGKTPFKRFIK